MIILKSKLKEFQLATSFRDITFQQYKEIVSPEVSEFRQIEILTGLNEIEASILDLESLSKYIDFLKENPFESIEASDFLSIEGKEIRLPLDIGEKTWGQKIVAMEAFKESNPLTILSPYLQPLYAGKEFDLETIPEIEEILSRIPMEDLFSGVNFIKEQLIEISEREYTLLKSDISFEQVRAGIDMFNQLGEFNTIDLIAGGDVLKYSEVVKIDFNTILNKLFKLNLTSKFEKNYNEIIKQGDT